MVVFARDPSFTSARAAVTPCLFQNDSLDSPTRHARAVNALTIIGRVGRQPDDDLGVEPFGRAIYDVDYSGHLKGGLAATRSGVAVLQPGGILAFACALDNGLALEQRFKCVLHSSSRLLFNG